MAGAKLNSQESGCHRSSLAQRFASGMAMAMMGLGGNHAGQTELAPQHFLYFFPPAQGQASLRPIFSD